MPRNEKRRIEILQSYNILDSEPEETFDDLAHLAAHICGTPAALITLIDSDRQWFKACVGMEAAETSRSVAFCAHALESPRVMIVSDARKDNRFMYNPMVTDNPHIVFYAGAPLRSPEGEGLGTICAVDYRPRDLSPTQSRALETLSRQVMAHLESRRVLDRLKREISKRELAEQALARLQRQGESAPAN